MRVSSDTASIQMLKAQQAWEARRAASKRQPAAEATKTPAFEGPVDVPSGGSPSISKISRTPSTSTAAPAASTSAATGELAQAVNPRWTQTVREVQEIAHKAGFVGVSEQDIQRAYRYGESLLADYRV